MSADTVCPTPAKVRHDSKTGAIKHLVALSKDKPLGYDWNVYHCQCSAWHIGHRPGSLARRARQALRRVA